MNDKPVITANRGIKRIEIIRLREFIAVSPDARARDE